jgi:S1-C subfamily serine protease
VYKIIAMRRVRSVAVVSLLACSTAWAVDWRPLPASPGHQANVDVDSVAVSGNFTRFTVRRAYTTPQLHPSGKEYFTTRLLYVAECANQKATLAVTQYYGADRRLIQADVRPTVKRSELTPVDGGSELGEALKLACERAMTAKPAPGQGRSSSGSGIVVSREGTILTNRHVVQQCVGYEVIDDADRKLSATLQAIDETRDLALLKTEEGFRNAAPFRKDITPKLGEAVTVVGYPLAGVLGTKPTVGFGHVSSTVGLRGDPTQMQISVPIQRGNSGGPVLDQSGNVIGVVVSKLDALKLAQATGDLAQNVNFAIRGEFVRDFLQANRIGIHFGGGSAALPNTEIASAGAQVTVRVRCLKEAGAPQPSTAPR